METEAFSFAPYLIGLAVLLVIGIGGPLVAALLFRRVVPTNEVHIVQSSKKTTSYGKDTGFGNTYYEWPSWIPVIGVSTRKLPTSVFDLDLEGYEAYDRGRLPFVADVKAFFRISDSNVAAQRVASFDELQNQLRAIVQGAVRVVLAGSDIEDILNGRSTFGNQFTEEVREQLQNWGVSTVKNIELMDIRDSHNTAAGNSMVIKNIMEKKKSHIEMESRTEVAKNKQAAQVAEIEANQEVKLKEQSAQQQIGLRTVEAQREVKIQEQIATQAIHDQSKVTKDKEMAVIAVERQRQAEIERSVQVVKAEQDKQTAVIAAEAEKGKLTLIAEGNLETQRRAAEGTTLRGEAEASAKRAMELAPVQAQIALAKEIGENASYQNYLVTIRKVEAEQAVGIEQAKALSNAEVKVITNAGAPAAGLKSVMDLFSSKGGTEVAAMLEAVAQTDAGKALVGKLTGDESTKH